MLDEDSGRCERSASRPLAHRRQLGSHALGRKRFFPPVRISTKSPAIIQHFSIASTVTSPLPTPPRSTAAGITGKTQPPQGGAIDLDANGEPTGILRESAQDLVYKVIPPPSHDERRKGDELAINDALAHGVTSVQDFSDWDDFLVFEEMEKEGNLHLRISEWLPFKDSLDDLKKMRAHHDIKDPMLHTGMLKGFMDGSLGSRTAAMKAPFADDPANTGLPQFTQQELNKLAVERAAAGFQLGFHAIGDKAAAMALDAFSQPASQRPRAIASSTRRSSIPPTFRASSSSASSPPCSPITCSPT